MKIALHTIGNLIERLGALLAILILAPFLGLISLLVYFDLGTPILFRQTRIGLGGKHFDIVKFRTMRELTPGACTDAERVSTLGTLIRQLSLDELPQLLNVVSGDMSIVGPRPLPIEYASFYSTNEFRRHEVRPGLTGFAQVRGRNQLCIRDRIKLDLWYVDNRSILLDLKIVCSTIKVLLDRESAAPVGFVLEQSPCLKCEDTLCNWRSSQTPQQSSCDSSPLVSNSTSGITSSWDHLLEQMPGHLWDVYMREGYITLHENRSDTAQCFFYKESGETFLLPHVLVESKDCPAKYAARSTYGYGGPLSTSDDGQFIAAACASFAESMKVSGVGSVNLRFHPILENQKLVSEDWIVTANRRTAGIDLAQAPESLLAQMHQNHRNVVRKAERLGLQFVWDSRLERIADFIPLYAATMSRLDAEDAYRYPDTYFHALREKLGADVNLALVLHGDTVISGALFLRHGEVSHYHLSGTDIESRTTGAGTFLLYKSALELQRNGSTLLHVGGGTTPDADDSLFRFKRRFGGPTFTYYTGVYPIFD